MSDSVGKVYTYVGNDPLDKTDPTGQCPLCLIPLIIEGAELIEAAALTKAAVATTGVLVAGAAAEHIINNESSKSDDKPKPAVNEDKQGKHQPDHPNFQPGKSELDHPDPQSLVDKGAGTGQQVGDKPVGEAGSKERVTFDEPIGTHVDPATGDRTPTNTGIIHYGENDVHIVPARPQPPPPRNPP